MAEPASKRARVAPARHGDFVDDGEDEDDEDARKASRRAAALAPPKEKAPPKAKAPAAPPPKLKLTLTAPVAQLSAEEQSLMAKYAMLRDLIALRRERHAAADAKEAANKPASVEETAMQLAMLQGEEGETDGQAASRAPPSRRGPSKRKASDAPSNPGSGTAGFSGGGRGALPAPPRTEEQEDDDDGVGYSAVDEFD